MSDIWDIPLKLERNSKTLFYKPACLVVVLDAIDDGTIKLPDIKSRVILERFKNLVRRCVPNCSQDGRQPFWRLSGDGGSWNFYPSAGHQTPVNTRPVQPPSQSQLAAFQIRIDQSRETEWYSLEHRRALRERVLEMLLSDRDQDCQNIADFLKKSYGSAYKDVRGKSGWVYILSNPAQQGIKIGSTEGAVEDRARDLYTTGVPTPFDVEFKVLVTECARLESTVHRRLRAHRIGSDREFFAMPSSDAEKIVLDVTTRHAIDGTVWARRGGGLVNVPLSSA